MLDIYDDRKLLSSWRRPAGASMSTLSHSYSLDPQAPGPWLSNAHAHHETPPRPSISMSDQRSRLAKAEALFMLKAGGMHKSGLH